MKTERFVEIFNVRGKVSKTVWEEFMDLLSDYMVDSFAIMSSLEDHLNQTFVDGDEMRSWLEDESKVGYIAEAVDEEVFLDLVDALADEIEARIDKAEMQDKDFVHALFLAGSAVDDFNTLLGFIVSYLNEEAEY